MKRGSGNFAAKDVLPTPSGPYTITFWAFGTMPRVMLSAIYITHFEGVSVCSTDVIAPASRTACPLR